jgi:molybdopterin synthase catalytic subunit/molybdopterin converting factor small subunit
MRIHLLAFASAGDALGTDRLDVELPDGAGLAELRLWLDVRYPALAPLWQRLAVAVNGAVRGGDQPLAEGDEVALLPPVSGGADSPPPNKADTAGLVRPAVELVETAIDPHDAISRVAAPGRGAIVLFLGTVRDHAKTRPMPSRGAGGGAPSAGAEAAPSSAGRTVLKLTYSAYRPMALAALRRIVAELEAAAPGLRVAIVHRLGEVPAGEASVAIAAAAPHRAAAYAASRTCLERLKTEVPIWKLEHYAGGDSAWREEEPLLRAAEATAGDPPPPAA